MTIFLRGFLICLSTFLSISCTSWIHDNPIPMPEEYLGKWNPYADFVGLEVNQDGTIEERLFEKGNQPVSHQKYKIFQIDHGKVSMIALIEWASKEISSPRTVWSYQTFELKPDDVFSDKMNLVVTNYRCHHTDDAIGDKEWHLSLSSLKHNFIHYCQTWNGTSTYAHE